MTVSSPSSPAPTDSARFLLGSIGSGVASADSSAEGPSDGPAEEGVPKAKGGVVEPNEKAGAVDLGALVEGLVPKEKANVVGFGAELAGLTPKLKLGAADLLVSPDESAPIEKTGLDDDEPKLKPVCDAPNDGFVASVPEPDGFAPPNVSCGVDPPGPNLPSPGGGEAASTFADG
jgi:hypothetical protein